MFKFRKEDVRKQLQEIELEEEKHKSSIKLLHPKWDVNYHLNSLVIVSAPSGNGKSTMMRQDLKECIFQGLDAVVFSNEETKSAILRLIYQSLSIKCPEMTKLEIMEGILEHICIIDYEDCPLLFQYDKIHDLIITAIDDFLPDLVMFNNISKFKKPEGKYRKQAYEFLPELIDSFSEEINSLKIYPPIIFYQQGRGLLGSHAGEGNKDATNTVNTATHVIQVVREGKDTIIETQKYRYPNKKKYHRFHKFAYDFELDEYKHLDAFDEYEKKRGNF